MASLELSEQLRWKTNMIANESQGAAHKNFIFHEHHFSAGARISSYHFNFKFSFFCFGLHTAYMGYFPLYPCSPYEKLIWRIQESTIRALVPPNIDFIHTFIYMHYIMQINFIMLMQIRKPLNIYVDYWKMNETYTSAVQRGL